MNGYALPSRLLAEALGTGALVATVVGSGIMAERLAGGSMALALLGNTLPTGAILVVLITLFAPVSGAHFNPVVTGLLAVRRALPFREAASYTAAQVLGGLLGTVLAHAMFALTLVQSGAPERSGPNLWLAEAVATAGLVLTILVGHRSRPEALPWLVGLYITAAYWFTASTSFANPAVTLARSLTATFAGIRPEDVAGFVAAQILGACLGAAVAQGMRPRTA